MTYPTTCSVLKPSDSDLSWPVLRPVPSRNHPIVTCSNLSYDLFRPEAMRPVLSYDLFRPTVRTPGHLTSDFVSIFDLDEEKGLINSSLKDWF